jgi:RNA polymerase sigma factor (sigma-70 family)
VFLFLVRLFGGVETRHYTAPMPDVTQLLDAIQQGEPQAAEELLPLVYDELRKLARAKLRQEQPGQTLEATALVHEAYLRLVGGDKRSEVRSQRSDEKQPASDLQTPTSDLWHSRGHFFAAAAEAMRRILIEQARRKRTLKHGGARQRLELEEIVVTADDSPADAFDLLALDEALQKLERENPRKAQLVKLRYFAGLTLDQAADCLGVATSTASADWLYAKSWLRLEMRPAG